MCSEVNHLRSSEGPQKRNGTGTKSRRKKKAKRPWGWMHYSIFVFVGMAAAVVLFVVAFASFINLTPFDPAPFYQFSQPTVVYSGDGKVYMTIQPNGGVTDLQYPDIPADLRNALVATEDHGYWTSSSIDLRGILRAAFYDLWTGSRSQGASTIQAQLAKIVYLNDNKTFSYKLKQMALGVQIDRHFTKQEILRMYLTRVYLGENTIGVGQAAERYFGVDLSQHQPLTLPQAAMLAGLPQAPSGYDPLLHPHAALQRRNEVLANMVKYGYITQARATTAEQAPLGASFHTLAKNAWDAQPLFTNFLLDNVGQLGISRQSVLQGGLKIYTTISPTVQNAVNQVFWSGNYNGDFPAPVNGKPVDGAAIFTDPQTGAVLGAAGSRQTDYAHGGLDRVFSYSSPGSSIKPVMEYAPALATGKWTFASKLDNTPHDFGSGYTPQNDAPGEPKSVTLQYALEQSQNVASVWLLQHIGIQTGVQFAENDGIPLTQADTQHLSIAIGGMENGVTPWQMAQAYEAFDNGGVQVKEHLITQIVNQNGRTVYFFQPTQKRIMSSQLATTMTQLMEDVVQYGTGTYAQIPGWGVAGKTGTVQWDSGLTSYHPDWISRAWWDGYTPNMVGSVYLGYDDPHDSVYHLSWSDAPNHYCELIWKTITQLSETGLPAQQFSIGPSPGPEPLPGQTGSPGSTNSEQPPTSSQPVIEAPTASWDSVGNGVFLQWLYNGTVVSPSFLISRMDGAPASTGGSSSAGGGTGTGTGTTMTLLDQTTATTYEDTSVLPGATYTYSIQATDPATAQPIGPATSVTITVPAAGGGSGQGGVVKAVY